ncbi:MAG: hypothetical protein COT24_04750 [Candidatus Kerfeldbacteria bacterium CG08_land_8_20_14_0_20_40_16]|uniref:CDP-diacylglycerol--glycerol-3-phosphate 3-phosphatidyltransferase n=1 Tax=Candidatus Kerfeldbacteria bacterium CG08_land_8_20_14_0_20_40_16 TaxID=2014244 RepID=A0A2H0YUM6_9BACT|nr:MAG: hypothetical protein COT24_04750 [Candidatus Kerfeldbacteria bacterium CG08_land_8_20_14_0_20_40_16]
MSEKQTKFFWKIFNNNEILLQKIADRFPDSVTPNFLTFIRILMTIPIILAAEEKRYLLAALLFLIAYFFDLIDGPLARIKNRVTEFGKIFDPAADKIVFLSVLYVVGKRTLPSLLIFVIFSLEFLLVSLPIIFKPIATHLGLVAELGANIYGKIKMFFQTLGIITLFILLIFKADVLAVVIIFIIASFFSALSILAHVFSVKKKKNLS